MIVRVQKYVFDVQSIPIKSDTGTDGIRAYAWIPPSITLLVAGTVKQYLYCSRVQLVR